MNLKEWAKNEIDLACKREREASGSKEDEWDYGCACYESAYKAFCSLVDDNHGGFSIGITKSVLNRLIDRKPLTPIEDTPDVWSEGATSLQNNYTTQQCIRMSSLFKYVYDDGSVKYSDLDRWYCVNRDDPEKIGWKNGFVCKILDEMFPITMPYYPDYKPSTVYCTEGLSDPGNGDFDTIGIWSIVNPAGERIYVERFFKYSLESHEWVEISMDEFQSYLSKTRKEDKDD